MWHYLRDPTFSHFDTIPECDRQTHRHMTTAYTTLSISVVRSKFRGYCYKNCYSSHKYWDKWTKIGKENGIWMPNNWVNFCLRRMTTSWNICKTLGGLLFLIHPVQVVAKASGYWVGRLSSWQQSTMQHPHCWYHWPCLQTGLTEKWLGKK